MVPFSRMLPKTRSDIFAFTFCLIGMNMIFFFELFVVLPWVEARKEEAYAYGLAYYLHIFAACFLYVNCMVSFWKTISTETSTTNIILPSILKQGWRFCSSCEMNAPPRSYHCFTCKRCILRRDHHCVFTGNCIGLANHRYYMMLIFYNWIAAIYANFMNFEFIWYVVGEISVLSVLNLIFPFFSWVVGAISFTTMCKSALLLLSIAVGTTLTALFAFHMQNLYYGQITHERTHKIYKYNVGWKMNVAGVFGENWKISWLSPLIPSELPGNGLEFPISGLYENPKDM